MVCSDTGFGVAIAGTSVAFQYAVVAGIIIYPIGVPLAGTLAMRYYKLDIKKPGSITRFTFSVFAGDYKPRF